MTTQKNFDDKDQQIAVLEKALKLACDKISTVQVITDAQMQDYFEKPGTKSLADYFIRQAEKEIKGENK